MTPEGDIAVEQATNPSDRPDPVGRGLTVIALLLLVAVVGVGVGMVLYLRDGFDVPRSIVERDIAAYEAAVLERPEEQANHLQLASAYARAGRTELAMESIALAREIGDNAAVDLAEAQVLRLAGENRKALALYEGAEASALEEIEQAEEEMLEQGVRFALDKTVLVQAANGQAVVLWELDRQEEAVAAVRRALESAPRDASLYVLLGDYLAESGDEVGAREAYLAALRFIPDYPAATEGLRDLRETSGE